MNLPAIYGGLGILAYDPVEDKVQCHICGEWFRGLNSHVLRTHGWTVEEYREEFGLNRGQSLICEGTRTILRQINQKLENWKHLASQTMTKKELSEFLRSVQRKPGFKLRTQASLSQTERFKIFDPLNQPNVQQRAQAREREVWYGSERMRSICRKSILNTIAKLRERNLIQRRWPCSCGESFPTKKEGEHHRAKCPVAREQVIQKQQQARQEWWKELSPDKKELFRQNVSEGRKRQYAKEAKSKQ